MTDADRFRQLVAGEPSPANRRALEIACWYHVATEEHDRVACRLLRDGVPTPTEPDERDACSRFAREMLAEAREVAAREGVSEDELRRALGDAGEMTHAAREDIVARAAPFPRVREWRG